MFYVGIKNGDQTVKVQITDENVFQDCPICGDTKLVDLGEMFGEGGDLFGTNIYCKECYENFMKD